LHAYSYTPTLTRLLLHAYSYTPTLIQVRDLVALDAEEAALKEKEMGEKREGKQAGDIRVGV